MEWEEITIDICCDLIAGYAFKSKDFGEFDTKVIRIGDITPPFVHHDSAIGVNLANYDHRKIERYKIKYNDFVLAMTGATIGKVGRYISDVPSYVNQRVLLFKSKEGYDHSFIYYTINSYVFSQYVLNHIDSESAQPNISANTISKFSFKIPANISDQRKIAGILSALDSKIENNNKINANLEAQAQALFKSWFVDFTPFKDQPFVDSELGPIPQGWKVGKLGDLGEIVGGSTPSKSKPEYYTTHGIAWLTPKDLSTSKAKFTSRGEIDITDEGYNSTSTKLMPRGSVLFSSRAPIGYLTIAKNEICTNQGFKSLVPNGAGTGFIYYTLRHLTPQIENRATGSTFKEASATLMRSVETIVPPTSILNKFEELLRPILQFQEKKEEENQRLAALRDTLLPKLMSGEIKL